jgi:hypothetical protein
MVIKGGWKLKNGRVTLGANLGYDRGDITVHIGYDLS